MNDTDILGLLCVIFCVTSVVGWVEVYCRRQISKCEDFITDSLRRENATLRDQLNRAINQRDHDDADWWKDKP